MDQNQEAEIWTRVRNNALPSQSLPLEAMLRESAQLAAVYRWAAGHLAGREKALAQQLLESEEAAAACLRGISRLSGTAAEALRVWTPTPKQNAGLLEDCYRRTRRCQAEYTAHSPDPMYGEVFRHLAEQAAKQSVLLAQLLGRISQKHHK